MCYSAHDVNSRATEAPVTTVAVVPQMTGMVKLAVLAALVGIASAAPRIINDQTFVDAINAVPGITWQAGASERFNGMTMSEFRSMNGVKPGSWKEVLLR